MKELKHGPMSPVNECRDSHLDQIIGSRLVETVDISADRKPRPWHLERVLLPYYAILVTALTEREE